MLSATINMLVDTTVVGVVGRRRLWLLVVENAFEVPVVQKILAEVTVEKTMFWGMNICIA